MQRGMMIRGPYWISDMFVRYDMPAAATQALVTHEHRIVLDPDRFVQSRKDGTQQLMRGFKTGIGLSLAAPVGQAHFLYCVLTRVPYAMTFSGGGALHWFAITDEAKRKSEKLVEALTALVSLRNRVPWHIAHASRTHADKHNDLCIDEYAMPDAGFTLKPLRNVVQEIMPWHKEYRDELVAAYERRKPIVLTYTGGIDSNNRFSGNTHLSITEGD